MEGGGGEGYKQNVHLKQEMTLQKYPSPFTYISAEIERERDNQLQSMAVSQKEKKNNPSTKK